jgi:hypothetical protein
MRNKPGPRKKPGERYPSGDLKPAIAPALWGRIRDLGDRQLRSELGRLYLHGELTQTQATAGFLIADIYRCGESTESTVRGHVTGADTRGNPRAAAGGRIALDRVLSEYAPKPREAVIELCVFNRPVDWTLYPEIRRLLDRVSALWPDTRQADGSKLPRRSILHGTPALHRALMRRRRRAADDIQGPDGTELSSDFDAVAADIEAVKKLFAKLLPDLDADGMARLIDEWVTLRDREVFRQEKEHARQQG